MEAAYSSRIPGTNSLLPSSHSVRATRQPMVKVPWAPDSVQASLRSMASRTSLFCIMTVVAAGTGSMHRSMSPEAMRAVSSSLASHWMSTSAAGSRPFASSR